MKKTCLGTFLVLFILLTGYTSPASAAKIITLKDGSAIRGELLSFDEGVYSVMSDTLGQMYLSEEDVSSIADLDYVSARPAESKPVVPGIGASGFPVNGEMRQIQNSIMQNPQMMQQIMALTEDPQLMNLLSDEALMQELMEASMNGDYESLESNPKFQTLLNHPQLKNLTEQIQNTR